MTMEAVVEFKDLKPGDKFIALYDERRGENAGMVVYVKLDKMSGFALFPAISIKTGAACHIPAEAEDLKVIKLDF